MTILFGASANFYGGTIYGSKVDGAPSMVRSFSVVAETSRSYVLASGAKVSKKSMEFNTGNFVVSMFFNVDDAVESLKPKNI